MIKFNKKKELRCWFEFEGANCLRGFGIETGDRVVDFGSGIGSYAVPLAQIVGECGEVTVFDNNATNLKVVKKRVWKWMPTANLRVIKTNGETTLTEIGDDSQDAALVFDVLQHIDDWDELFANLSRTLRTNGRLLINPGLLSHPGRVDENRLKTTLTKHGFELVGRKQCRLMHYKHFTEDEVWLARCSH